MYTQGDKDGAEKVWYCTEKSKCKWQGFALNAGLSWGELKNTTAEWQKYHSQFCKGTLVQGVIVDQQYETRALKEQMERVITDLTKILNQPTDRYIRLQDCYKYVEQLKTKMDKTELLEGDNG